jgi:single-strand DNA-binding protein
MLNKLILIGNVTKDVELKETSKVKYAKISIAVQRSYANSEGERETDFFEFTVFDKRAEVCAKYVKKGSKIAVVGSLFVNSYEDDNGNKRYKTEIRCEEVEFLSARKEEGETKERPSKDKLVPVEDDDLPF